LACVEGVTTVENRWFVFYLEVFLGQTAATVKAVAVAFSLCL
jgi:hypothetical protein